MLQRTVETRQGRIITDVEVSAWNPAEAITFRGLIDTGTQQSGISRNVIDALGNGTAFVPHGFDYVKGIGGRRRRTPFYTLWVGLRFARDDQTDTFGGLLKPFWLMPEVEDGFDVLVGMDIIERFAVEINNGTCTFRLRS